MGAALAMLLGIYLHGAMSFMTVLSRGFWPAQDIHRHGGFDVMVLVLVHPSVLTNKPSRDTIRALTALPDGPYAGDGLAVEDVPGGGSLFCHVQVLPGLLIGSI
ncbi:hypothetical protein [Archangium violaceum]|uniref:hypothetical protein n=1 Tax=Archangium violaceum TaxID=83451 RepID=UPI0037BF740A